MPHIWNSFLTFSLHIQTSVYLNRIYCRAICLFACLHVCALLLQTLNALKSTQQTNFEFYAEYLGKNFVVSFIQFCIQFAFKCECEFTIQCDFLAFRSQYWRLLWFSFCSNVNSISFLFHFNVISSSHASITLCCCFKLHSNTNTYGKFNIARSFSITLSILVGNKCHCIA